MDMPAKSATEAQVAQSKKEEEDAARKLASQSARKAAQAQLAFAELQGIKAGINSLTLPAGKEGTVSLSVGKVGTALLRSRKPMLDVLDKAADELKNICSNYQNTVLVTEAELSQAITAQVTLRRIDHQRDRLTETVAAVAGAEPKAFEAKPKGLAPLPVVTAAAYGLGFAAETINSFTKLLRTNRQLDVFNADAEATQLLGYLLESKGCIGSPAISANKEIEEADSLLAKLSELANALEVANDQVRNMPPTNPAITALKGEIDGGALLLDSLHPSRKPEGFSAQVKGQVLATAIEGKDLLLLDVKAQAVQITESRWLRRDRILATGEVQVAYRIFDKNGRRHKSGVMLKASKPDAAPIDKLLDLTFSRHPL